MAFGFNFNYYIGYGEFCDELKHADVKPAHKKNEKCEKTNYIPVDILINISKIYEKLMYNQSNPLIRVNLNKVSVHSMVY